MEFNSLKTDSKSNGLGIKRLRITKWKFTN
jgi:hypothetical protein